MAAEDGDGQGVPGSGVVWPEKGSLAKCWESRVLLREQVRVHRKLLAWPSAILTGVASVNALKLNRYVVADIIKIWSGTCHEPSPPPVAWLRQEAPRFQNTSMIYIPASLTKTFTAPPTCTQVSLLHSMLLCNGDHVNEYVDHWGAKRLTSYCIRRFRSGIATFKD